MLCCHTHDPSKQEFELGATFQYGFYGGVEYRQCESVSGISARGYVEGEKTTRGRHGPRSMPSLGANAFLFLSMGLVVYDCVYLYVR
jgi:hypothetical protein